MTGAVIALSVKQPAIVILLAFASHFVLDMIPHFGIYEDDVIRRNRNWLFRTVVTIDIIIMLALLVIVPHLAAAKLAWGIVLAGMISALSPDLLWVPMFIREVRTKQWRSGGRFVTFHQSIQKFEKPIGLIVELVWLIATSFIFAQLI